MSATIDAHSAAAATIHPTLDEANRSSEWNQGCQVLSFAKDVCLANRRQHSGMPARRDDTMSASGRHRGSPPCQSRRHFGNDLRV